MDHFADASARFQQLARLPLQSRLAIRGACAAVVIGALVAGGCGGDSPPPAGRPEPAPQRAPAAEVPEAPDQLAEAPVEQDLDPEPQPRMEDDALDPATPPSPQPESDATEATEPEADPEPEAQAEPDMPPPQEQADDPETPPEGDEAEAPGMDADEQPEEPAPVVPQYERQLLLIEEPSPATQALADIFGRFATGARQQQEASPAILKQGAAMAAAAVRLAPEDARLARELVEVQMRLGDVPAALEALDHYRSLRREDVLAQVRYVDLSAEQMESADEKLSYLLRIVETPTVHDIVRSHAAAMASLLLRERLDDRGADQMVVRAVELDPYSPLALQLNYERHLSQGAARPARVQALAMLARSNLLQPAVLTRLAEELASAGLLEESNELYQQAGRVYRALNVSPPQQLVLDVAALQLVADRPRSAQQTLGGLNPLATGVPAEGHIKLTPVQIDALLLQPMIVSTGGAMPAEPVRQTADVVGNALRAWVLVPTRRRLDGEPPMPALGQQGQIPDTPLPDVIAIAQRFREGQLSSEQMEAQESFVVALSDLAWLDLYYRKQPTDDRILQALELLVPGESVTLARLRGWQLWRQDQPDAAREKLSAISEQDALASLALFLLDAPAAGADAGDPLSMEAQRLLNRHPSGLVGAFMADALRPYGARVQPSEDASAVRSAYGVLPQVLFELLEPENVRNFYTVSAEPRSIRHAFADPILLDVTIRNSGRHPVTVGPEGVIQPVVRMDVLVRGVNLPQPHPYPAAGVAELWGTTRLDPGQKIDQTMRLDGPGLYSLLASAPQFSLTLESDVTTNPAVIQTEQGPGFVIGPAGQSFRVKRMIDRRGYPLELSSERVVSEINQRLEQLRSGQPLERMRAAQTTVAQMQWIGGYLQQRQQEGGIGQDMTALRDLGGQMSTALQRAAAGVDAVGPDAAANAWVKFSAASAVQGEGQTRLIRQLLNSSAFEARLVGLLAVGSLIEDPQVAVRMAAPLAEDPDPAVRLFAVHLIETARQADPEQPVQPGAVQPGMAQPEPVDGTAVAPEGQ